MFMALTTFNSCILKRTPFTTLKAAKEFALKESREKIFNLSKGKIIYGDFNVMIYEISSPVFRDHLDIPVYVAYGK
jgi:hypothetical protein